MMEYLYECFKVITKSCKVDEAFQTPQTQRAEKHLEASLFPPTCISCYLD
jgi:hypothetical protein